VTNDLIVNKTVLCVTSSNKVQNVVTSRLRTLKVMRAALAGIPIVTPAWITECLQTRTIVLPPPSFSKDHPMFVSTLPSKLLPNQHPFGVWSLAASSSLLLDQCHVYLCGTWKKNAKKDIQLLLRQTGANILSNASATLEIIQQHQLTTTSTTTLVLVCHESSNTDKQSGITQQLSKSILQKSSQQIMVVNSNWLFDCITSAQKLDSTQYPPSIPKANSLWQKLQ